MTAPTLAFSHLSHLVSRRVMRPVGISMAMVVTALLMVACSKKTEKLEEIRPVRAIAVAADKAVALAEFSGEVKARYESQLGFRVGGKIVAREVDVGTQVKRGQVLMRLDPQDLQLAQRQAEAGLRSAQSSRDYAAADLKRYRELRDKNFVSQAALDGKVTAYDSAASSVEQAQAALRNQANQTGYASLVADADGVVTAINAEAGQVVSAGTPVASVARGGDKDVVIGVPENRVDALRKLKDVRVRLWADPQAAIAGAVREVSPIADAATRTYAVKVALPMDANVKLGMTAYVAFMQEGAQPVIRLPLSALSAASGAGSSVWVVESGAVRKVPVTLGATSGNEVAVDGLTAGQVVVTAGVNLLVPGQKVKILGAEESVRPQAENAQAGVGPAGAAR